MRFDEDLIIKAKHSIKIELLPLLNNNPKIDDCVKTYDIILESQQFLTLSKKINGLFNFSSYNRPGCDNYLYIMNLGLHDIKLRTYTFFFDRFFEIWNNVYIYEIPFVIQNKESCDDAKFDIYIDDRNIIKMAFDRKFFIYAKGTLEIKLPFNKSNNLLGRPNLFMIDGSVIWKGISVKYDFLSQKLILTNHSFFNVDLGYVFINICLPAPTSFISNEYNLKKLFKNTNIFHINGSIISRVIEKGSSEIIRSQKTNALPLIETENHNHYKFMNNKLFYIIYKDNSVFSTWINEFKHAIMYFLKFHITNERFLRINLPYLRDDFIMSLDTTIQDKKDYYDVIQIKYTNTDRFIELETNTLTFTTLIDMDYIYPTMIIYFLDFHGANLANHEQITLTRHYETRNFKEIFDESFFNSSENIEKLVVSTEGANGIDIIFDDKYILKARSNTFIKLPFSENYHKYGRIIMRSRFSMKKITVHKSMNYGVYIYNGNDLDIDVGNRFLQILLEDPYPFHLKNSDIQKLFKNCNYTIKTDNRKQKSF